MANIAQSNPQGGFWPLGQFNITGGTPVLLTDNVGSEKQGPLQMAKRIRQLIISGAIGDDAGVTLYLVMKGHDATETNCVIAAFPTANGMAATAEPVPPPASVPDGCLLDKSMPTPDQYALDCDAGKTVSCFVTAIYG